MATEHKKVARQAAGLKLCFALMLGLLVVPAYVVVPLLFGELESVQAGLIAGKIFHISNLAILLLAVAAAIFCYRLSHVAKSTWYVLIAVALLVACNTFAVASVMAMIKAEAGDISALAQDDSMRWMFAFWHGLGSIIHLLSTLLAAALVMKSLCPQRSQPRCKEQA
ncbi:MAG: DUF4149 domain-containing protein [Ghiorsea sp.]